MVDDNFGLQNSHYHQRWSCEVNGVPNVRPSIEWVLYKLGQGKVIMEVGIGDGSNAKVMLSLLNPSKMLLVDMREDEPWKCYNTFTCPPCEVHLGLSQRVLRGLPENSLDFAYIDADHATEPVVSDILNCIRLVKVSGVVGGDDYDSGETKDVAAALHQVFDAIGLFNQVRNDGYDWWVTVTQEMKDAVCSLTTV